MQRLRKAVVSKIDTSMRSYDTAGVFKKLMVAFMVHFVPGQMSCETYDALMDDRIDDKLPERERKKFDLHSQICPMCRTHFGEYKATVTLLRSLSGQDQDKVPDALMQAIFPATPGE